MLQFGQESFRDPGREGSSRVIQSVDRAARVLFALQGERRLGIADLAARLELAPSTVHGIVKTLAAHNLVVQDAGSGRYQLGPAVLRLGNVYLDSLELRSRAMAWSEELARRTGMAVRTGVLAGDDVVIIHHEPRPDGSRQMPEIGIVIPAHASALGKAQLAFLPADAARVLGAAHRSMTGDTITDADELREQLAVVARTALAEERDEAVLGESSVAAPIFAANGAAIGAIGVVLPTTDWPVDESVRVALRESARNVSRELGAARWPA
ncbi:MAG: IclR family transcriptional regulator [Pseudonocardiales bacterium]|jgi:DNA-binding IclR family transcriptional regulator|nr:IclR family transcriptional regulator [Pseudonocardiales bacterium]